MKSETSLRIVGTLDTINKTLVRLHRRYVRIVVSRRGLLNYAIPSLQVIIRELTPGFDLNSLR